MSSIKFIKMHANGDHFVLIDARGHNNPVTSHLAKRLGDKNRGIGFNQLAVLLDSDDAAARLIFWNPDGTKLGACGSATRGAAELIMVEEKTDLVVFRTDRGLLTCKRMDDHTISVDMGAPLLNWQDIPLASKTDTLSLPLKDDPAACSMGNPHCTFFVDDLEQINISKLGPKIETNAIFPQKTNVHFVQIINQHSIRLRIWERGGGIPEGSGSCSCGAAVNAIRRGFARSPVTVECDGGSVSVSWNGKTGVMLSGRVETIFKGIIPAEYQMDDGTV